MVLDPTLLGLFLVAALLICVAPGPDMLYILATSLSQGSLAGVVASLGMAVGMVVHTTLVTLGLAAVLKTSPMLYDAIRYAGAAYLVYLGYKAWRSSASDLEIEQRGRVPLWSVLRRAAVTNLLNPKIVLFYIAFLPQFVAPERGNRSLQLLLLGLIFVVTGLVIDSIIALLSGRAGELLVRRRGAGRHLDRVAGVIFLVLAVRLVVS